MNKTLPLLLVAGLVAVGLFVLLGGGGDEGPAVLPGIDPPVALDEPRTGAQLDEVDGNPGNADVVRAPVSEGTPAEPPAGVAANEGRARLFGRFLLPGGAPAAGVVVKLHGMEGNTERALEHGLPADWHDPATTTAEDGTFELRLDPPRAFQFFLDASL
ncbi:MAG: hypothetical protein P1V81_10425, partial [Planctomycetota bacterium]|nr:hypothetical protein [Planctomycetota bacterium]